MFKSVKKNIITIKYILPLKAQEPKEQLQKQCLVVQTTVNCFEMNQGILLMLSKKKLIKITLFIQNINNNNNNKHNSYVVIYDKTYNIIYECFFRFNRYI